MNENTEVDPPLPPKDPKLLAHRASKDLIRQLVNAHSAAGEFLKHAPAVCDGLPADAAWVKELQQQMLEAQRRVHELFPNVALGG